MASIQKSLINDPFSYRTTADKVMKHINLHGKNVIVTGGYSGIGLKVVTKLSKAGAHVIVPARSVQKAEKVLHRLSNIDVYQLDLMDSNSIENFGNKINQNKIAIDLLICNAGIMFAPLRRDSRGNESQLSTNYLGHFELVSVLYSALKLSKNARVILVTSRSQSWNGIDFNDPNFETKKYDSRMAYAQSKVADILFAVELDKKAKKDHIRAFAVHPGLVPGTNLGRFMVHDNHVLSNLYSLILNRFGASRLFSWKNKIMSLMHENKEYDYIKNVNQGAASILWAATSHLLDGMGGVFIEDCNVGISVPSDSKSKFGVRPWSVDSVLAQRLWFLGEKLSRIIFEP